MKHTLRSVRLTRSRLAIGLAIAVAVAVTTLVNQSLFGGANADSHESSGEVRVATRSLDDGRVEVAVQQRAADSEWGARELPDARYLPADVESGVWRVSSGVPIGVGSSGGVGSGPLYCVVAHGHATDPFWGQVRGFLYQSAGHLGAHVRFHSSPDGAEQAAAISQCSADGARAIAATLANPEAVTEALLEAKASGVRIATFNSGADLAQAAGSELHLALNDSDAGRLIGRELNAQGITGVVGCLIHEQRNVGLDERCEGLAETYRGGNVERIQLPSADDRESVATAIAGRLSATGADQIDIVVTLNGGTSALVLEVIAEIEERTGEVIADKRLVAVGYSEERGALRRARASAGKPALDVLGISDASEVQGYFIVSALMYVGNHPLTPAYVDQPAIMLITPWNLDAPGVFRLSQAERFAVGQAYRAVIAQGEQAQAEANGR